MGDYGLLQLRLRWIGCFATASLLVAVSCWAGGWPTTDKHNHLPSGTVDLTASVLRRQLNKSYGNGEPPLIIGISGGSGCGKTTLARRVAELGRGVAIISTDAYYRSLTEEQSMQARQGSFNFDRLEALDMDRLENDIRRMKANVFWPVDLPAYDFLSHQRNDIGTIMQRPEAIVLEGLFVLAVPTLRDLFDVKLFAKDDVDRCLVQRLRRDSEERGIPMDTALTQYENHVKPAYDTIIKPSAAYADLVVPAATRNEVAAELVAGWITSRIKRQPSSGSENFAGCRDTETCMPELAETGL